MGEIFKSKNDNRESDIVFSRTVTAGKRIYYLDVKRNRKGELFIAITESKKVFGDDLSQPVHFEKHKLFLYKEDFDKFFMALDDTLTFAKENNTVDFVPMRESHLDEEMEEPFHLKIDF
jgi:hypothetical protein